MFIIPPSINLCVFSPAFQNEYMKDDFMIKIETWHKPDMGTIENVSRGRTDQHFDHYLLKNVETREKVLVVGEIVLMKFQILWFKHIPNYENILILNFTFYKLSRLEFLS